MAGSVTWVAAGARCPGAAPCKVGCGLVSLLPQSAKTLAQALCHGAPPAAHSARSCGYLHAGKMASLCLQQRLWMRHA